MNRLIAALFSAWLFSMSLVAEDYYVAPNGLNSVEDGNGLSSDKPFLTLQYVANRVMPGDTVYVKAGVYRNSGYGESTNNLPVFMLLGKKGTEGPPITFRNFEEERPVLEYDGNMGIFVQNGEYIILEGLEVKGNADNITLEEAMEHRQDNPRLRYYANHGIYIQYSNHVIVRDCKTTYCTGAGIREDFCDYLTIERNEVAHNTYYHATAVCAIEIMNPVSIDDSEGHKIVIRENVVYDNENRIPYFDLLDWPEGPDGFGGPNFDQILDGHGILVFNWPPETGYEDVWDHGRILIENNLCFGNGFNGIKLAVVNRADVRGNICFGNGVTPLAEDDLGVFSVGVYATDCADVSMENNVLTGQGGESGTLKLFNVTDVVFDNNTIFNGHTYFWNVSNVQDFDYEGDFWGDIPSDILNTKTHMPEFSSPSLVWADCDFSLEDDLILSGNEALFRTPTSESFFIAARLSGLSYSDWERGIDWLGVDSSALGDPNSDGLLNFLAYALNFDPISSGNAEFPVIHVEGDQIEFTFNRSRAENLATYKIQSSSDFETWDNEVTNPGEVGSAVTFPLSLPQDGTLLWRLKIELP